MRSAKQIKLVITTIIGHQLGEEFQASFFPTRKRTNASSAWIPANKKSRIGSLAHALIFWYFVLSWCTFQWQEDDFTILTSFAERSDARLIINTSYTWIPRHIKNHIQIFLIGKEFRKYCIRCSIFALTFRFFLSIIKKDVRFPIRKS